MPGRKPDSRQLEAQIRHDARLRCAVIGTGRIGSSLETDRLREKPASHSGAIAHNRDTVLVAGADPDGDSLAAFGRLWRLPESALFRDAGEMLSAVRPDVAHIAADTEAHIPLLRLCLEREVPVIVLEKPVAASLAEAREALPLVEAAEAAGKTRVVVNHERRFAADYRRVRSVIRSGELGPLRSVQARLYMGMKKTPARVLWHDGTHLVDILSFLVGPWKVDAVHGDSGSAEGNLLAVGHSVPPEIGPESTEGGTADGPSASPVQISLDVSPGRDYLSFEIDFNFASGRIRAGNGVYEEWRSEPSRFYENFRSLRLTTPAGKSIFRKTGYFSGMMAHAAALARDPSLPCESSFRDGIAALELLDSIISMS